ncbi:hypothetical protein GJ496_010165 [Pomphorhynchus laevis]|nr:hypothetical protein GJ496_010165 [Pomphorhynchus laevis]
MYILTGRFSGCEISIKDYLGLDKLTYMSILGSNVTSMNFLCRVYAPYLVHLSLSGNIIEELNFAIFKLIPNVQYLNLSFNRILTITKAQLPETYNLKSLDLRGNGIQESLYADYNVNLLMLDLINNSGLPQILCLHSMCIPGKHIERVVRKQSISNPYGYTCPTMYSNQNEFKYLKVNKVITNIELLAKHIFPCVEYIYLNRNSLWEYVRFTCKYNPEYEIYLSGNHIQNVKSVRMFYITSVLDISGNLLEDLLGSDCQDISLTKILPTLPSSSDKHLQEDPNQSSCGGSPVNLTNDFNDLIIHLPLSNYAVHLKKIPSCSDDHDSDAVNQYSLCKQVVSHVIRVRHKVFNTLAGSDMCDPSSVRQIIPATMRNHPDTINNLISFPLAKCLIVAGKMQDWSSRDVDEVLGIQCA